MSSRGTSAENFKVRQNTSKYVKTARICKLEVRPKPHKWMQKMKEKKTSCGKKNRTYPATLSYRRTFAYACVQTKTNATPSCVSRVFLQVEGSPGESCHPERQQYCCERCKPEIGVVANCSHGEAPLSLLVCILRIPGCTFGYLKNTSSGGVVKAVWYF